MGAFQFSATRPQDEDELCEFLARVFQTARDAPFIDPQLLRWKYFAPHPEWPGERSFLLRNANQVVAHGGLIPLRFLTPAGEVRGLKVIDWAASPAAPAGGLAVYRKLAQLGDVLLQVGGSEDARKIVPLLRFRELAPMHVYARVVRPWKQFHGISARSVARLARNAAWSIGPLAAAGSWNADPLRCFEEGRESAPSSGSIALCAHGPALLNYMLRCPGAAFSACRLMEDGRRRGYFLLSRVAGQARIADLRIDSGRLRDWEAAYAVAAEAAGRDSETCEVTAAASWSLAQQAIEANGFRLRARMPVWVRDPKGLLPQAMPLHLTMLDSDASFLVNREQPFLT